MPNPYLNAGAGDPLDRDAGALHTPSKRPFCSHPEYSEYGQQPQAG
jgi:hypothetical protein